tara:strand:+ start:11895 stop:12164 length:270 start_codon:yes stop_codon:yes gene_type:complete
MGLYSDLYRYKREKLYSAKKSRKDSRKYLGFDYSDNLLQNSLSSHILRNQTISDFVEFLTDYYYNTIKQIRVMKNWKNYTSKKDDKNIR